MVSVHASSRLRDFLYSLRFACSAGFNGWAAERVGTRAHRCATVRCSPMTSSTSAAISATPSRRRNAVSSLRAAPREAAVVEHVAHRGRTAPGVGVPVRRLMPAPVHATRAATSGLSSVLPATTSGNAHRQCALHRAVAAVGDHHVDLGQHRSCGMYSATNVFVGKRHLQLRRVAAAGGGYYDDVLAARASIVGSTNLPKSRVVDGALGYMHDGSMTVEFVPPWRSRKPSDGVGWTAPT